MTLTLILAPPQLPALISGEQLLAFALPMYPETQREDGGLREVALAMDEYNRVRGEYEARNTHYAEWIQWFNENPTGKEPLVKFLTEHQEWFSNSRAALEKTVVAAERSKPLAGDAAFLSGIRQSLGQATTDAERLAQNLTAINKAAAQGAQTAQTEQAGVPKILPRKRPRADNAPAQAGAAAPQTASADSRGREARKGC